MAAPGITVPLPSAFGTTVGLTSGPAIPANPSRGGLVFYNPSASVTVAICPSVLNSGTLGVYTGPSAGVAVINGAGSVTLNPGDKFIIDNLSCTAPYNAIASGPGGLLTVWEF